MKYINKSIYALALAGMMGLWSCSQEDVLPGGETTAKGHTVPLTLTVNRGDAQTRSLLSENEDGTLSDVWKEGDKLAVYGDEGKTYYGDLVITEGQDTSVGVFSGTLENVSDGEADYYLWYYDRSNSRITIDKDNYSYYRYNINYYNQDFSSVEALSAMDLLNQKITLNVKGENATVVKDYTMEAKLSMIHFSMPEELSNASGELKVYDSGSDTNCPITRGYFRVSCMNGKNPQPGNHDDSRKYLAVQVTNGEAYFAWQPYNNNTKSKLSFEFVYGGKTYTYAFENNTYLQPGYYYSTVLPLATEPEEEVIDHDKNPLKKWAESDLMMTDGTSGANAKSELTGNYGTTGDYYQFGRNQGWMNYTIINGNNYASNTAVAKINNSWAGGGSYASFTCDEYGRVNTTNLYNPYRGQGDATTTSWYNGSSTIKNFPGRFLFAGNESLEHFNGDYVFDTTIRHKHTWAERAEYCGYKNDICPEGYRLPTIEDWQKILPKGGHTYIGSDFSDISEIKTDGDVTYAIRWHRATGSNNNQYLRIDALVVPSTTTSTDNIDWSDANVETRMFKAAGAIKPSFFLARLIYSNGYQTATTYQWVAMAQPLCEFNYQYALVGGTSVSTKVNILRDDTKLGGYYWVDDAEQYAVGFRFDANNVQQQGSWINVFKFNQPYACNIRCIKKD